MNPGLPIAHALAADPVATLNPESTSLTSSRTGIKLTILCGNLYLILQPISYFDKQEVHRYM